MPRALEGQGGAHRHMILARVEVRDGVQHPIRRDQRPKRAAHRDVVERVGEASIRSPGAMRRGLGFPGRRRHARVLHGSKKDGRTVTGSGRGRQPGDLAAHGVGPGIGV
eukprot:4793308-Lingulodinium_polyedra.AAC.1